MAGLGERISTMTNHQLMEKWREFYAATLFDLPAAAAQSLMPHADRQSVDKVLNSAAWRAYDAWIWLVNETANRFYATSFEISPPPASHLRLAFSVLHPTGISAPVVDGSRHPGDLIEAR
jgi:hypothetical protein